MDAKANFQGAARGYGVAFSVSGYGYIATGIDNFGNYKSDLWRYDPVQNIWIQKASIPGVGRSNAVGFDINGKGYVSTGFMLPGALANDLWEYNPSNDTWQQKASTTSPREQAGAFVISNRAYLLGGFNNGPYVNENLEYDPLTNSWVNKNFLGNMGNRNLAVAFTIGTEGYMGTGTSLSGANNDFWEYNPRGIPVANNSLTPPAITIFCGNADPGAITGSTPLAV